MSNEALLTIPVPVVDGIGWTSTGSVSGSGAVTLSAAAISASGVAGTIQNAGITLPSIAVAASGLTGTTGAGATTLPAVTLVAYGPSRGDAILPVPVLSGSGLVGSIGSADLTVPAPVVFAFGDGLFLGSAALSFSTPVVQGTATAGIVGNVSATLRAIALAAEGHSGVIGSAAITLPVVEINTQGHQEIIGTASIKLPALQLVATARTQDQGITQAFAMHLETSALSTYEDFAFNSLARFNDVYIGASADGVFALTGGTDASIAPAAVIRSGVTDFGTSHRKRVTDMWVGYTASGDMELRVITDGTTVTTYPLKANNAQGIHGSRIRIGKGLLARYWQWEIVNLDGCDFSFDSIELVPQIQRRRHGGDDA